MFNYSEPIVCSGQGYSVIVVLGYDLVMEELNLNYTGMTMHIGKLVWVVTLRSSLDLCNCV